MKSGRKAPGFGCDQGLGWCAAGVWACLAALAAVLPARAQTVLYQETFDNGNATVAAPRLVTTYTGPGPGNVTYTADPDWVTRCDGWVAAWNSPVNPTSPPLPAPQPTQAAHCGNQSNWNFAQSFAQALGVYQGQPIGTTARDNLAIAALTAGTLSASGGIVLQNSVPISLSAIPAGGSGRFVTFSVLSGVANNNCDVPGAAAPLLNFYYVIGGVQTQLGGQINPCTAGQNPQIITVQQKSALSTAFPVRVSTLVPAGAGVNTLFTAPITFRIRNFQSSAIGNDFSLDTVTFLDVSPRLSKSVPGIRYVGAPMALSFTITNTQQDNQSKVGWAFTDRLPAGVVVAPTPGIVNGCGATSVVTALPGSDTISLSNGTLAAGTPGGTPTTCTLSVNVVSDTAGVYNNGAANILSSIGLNLPAAPTPMEWVVNQLTLTKVSLGNTAVFGFSGNNGIAAHDIATTAAGTPGTAGARQTLSAASATLDTTITEAPPPGWAMTAVDCTGLAAGQAASFAGNAATIPFAGLSVVSGGRNVACTITNTLSVDLEISKTNTPAAGPIDQADDTLVRGAATTYTLAVTNNGTGVVTGVVVKDAPGMGIACPGTNAVTIAGSGVPSGAFTVADLIGPGIALGALDAGQSTTLTFDCAVP